MLAQANKIRQAIARMPQSVQDHLGTAVEGKLEILWFEQVFKFINVLGPYLLRPETAAVIMIFTNVANDVVLLQQESHRFVQMGIVDQSFLTQPGLDGEASQTVADHTSHVPVIEVILFDGIDAGIPESRLSREIGHAIF
ncbi:hypothetical protein DL766_004683 [Monosporascus sp. MC13-8B]|uniref:Uncharacterized protein n=1 Tax=Monosporascus cannonballus TaxID=155416 RepID=A0ABY0H3I8_9PEZI|nr:hypothetical protein DL762_006217 [Monosporascus cannonballus]RYP30856.1 hypothetical protein DL766_004683 [Monosporascus sp. MC13-8B]